MAVIEALADAIDHPSAEDLVATLTSGRGDVHRATVYRTIESLVRAGVVAHVHLPHGATTYHLADSTRRAHLHVSCRGCGRVDDAPAELLDEAANRLSEDLAFQLDPDHVALTGWCPRCRPAHAPPSCD